MEIVAIDIIEFKEKIYKEYIKLFPEEERRSLTKIKNTYNKGIEKIYKIVNQNEMIGFILLEKIDDKHPYYIDYFAILKKYQNQGFGTQAIKLLIKNIVSSEGLCLEIEKVIKEDITTLKREMFYTKLGFKMVDSEYILYGVKYTPYIYGLTLDKQTIDKTLFDYYYINCGEKEVIKNCDILK